LGDEPVSVRSGSRDVTDADTDLHGRGVPPKRRRGICPAVNLPRMLRVRQRFEAPRVADVARAVRDELGRIEFAKGIHFGERVAIAAGSRGIANLAVAVRAVVDVLREAGAEPFIVPAMGSHGGGTDAGQRAI